MVNDDPISKTVRASKASQGANKIRRLVRSLPLNSGKVAADHKQVSDAKCVV